MKNFSECAQAMKNPQNSAVIFLVFIDPGVTWEDHSQKAAR